MADLSQMSDDELLAIASGKPARAPQAKQSAPVGDYSQYSDEDLLKIIGDSDKPDVKAAEFVKDTENKVLGGITKVGRFVDSYTGAPTRSAIGALQAGENPFRAFGKQFGSDPDLAPTGKDIAAKAGLSTEESIELPLKGITGQNMKVSPAGIAGVGIDVAADYTNLVPFGALAKTAVKGGVGAAKFAGKGLVAATDLATGSKLASDTVSIGKNAAVGTKEALSSFFKPTKAADYQDMVAIAEKNSLDPSKVLTEGHEYGPNSLVTRLARSRAEGFAGEPHLQKFANAADEIRGAAENKIKSISGGTVLNKQEAGSYIRQAYDQSVDDFFSKVEVTHNSIIKDYPGLKLTTGINATDEHLKKLDSTLKGIENFAKGRIKRGVTALQEEQGKRLINAVDAIRSTNGSYKQTVEALRDIGEAAFKSQNTLAAVPADIERMRDLYGALNDALIQTVRKNVQNGDAVANQLITTNQEISKFIDSKNPLAKVIGNKTLSDEAVFRSLVENGDSLKIKSLNAVLGPERMAPLKGAWMETLLKRDLDGSWGFKTAEGAIRNKRTVMQNLLSPEEIKDFEDLIRLGNNAGTPVLSTSGTGASNVFKDLKAGITGAVANDAFIETLKRRANQAGIAPPIELTKEIQPGQIQQLQDLLRQKRSGLGRSLKGAQAISTTQRDEDAMKRKLEQMKRP